MFGLFKKKDNPEREAAKSATMEFNSLVEDQHVNPENQKHMEIFNYVRMEAEKRKYKSLRIRGLKVDVEMQDGQKLVRCEVICFSE